MALSLSFTCKHTLNNSHRNLTPLSYIRSQATRRSIIIHTTRVKVAIPKPISGTTNVRNCISHQKKPGMGCKFAEEPDSSSEFDEVSDVIKKFCNYLNENNITKLQNLIHIDCCIEDTLNNSDPITYNKMTEVMNLLTQLAALMSLKQVQLKLDKYIPGEEKLTADVKWHIVLKDSGEPHPKNIRGTSTAHISREGDNKLLIRKLVNKTMSDEETNQEKPSSSPEQS